MTDTITIDFSEIEPRDKYKIMIGTIVPRPIAWVTTVDAGGHPMQPPTAFSVASVPIRLSSAWASNTEPMAVQRTPLATFAMSAFLR